MPLPAVLGGIKLSHLIAAYLGFEALPYVKGWFGMPPEEKRKFELSKAELGLQEKMFTAMQEGTKMTTKRSQERSDKMLQQMMGMRKEERGESRYRYMTGMMQQDKARQDQMLMGLVAALMQNRPRPRVPSGMPLSMVELLRR